MKTIKIITLVLSIVGSMYSQEYKEKGYINITELEINNGIGYIDVYLPNKDYSYGLKTMNGYQFNEHLILGLGIGILGYKEANYYPLKSMILIPITLDSRLSFIKGKASPTFNINMGYTINSGVVFNPSFGTRIYISKNISYLLNVGVKWQQQEVNTNYLGHGVYKKEKLYLGFLNISTGLSF